MSLDDHQMTSFQPQNSYSKWVFSDEKYFLQYLKPLDPSPISTSAVNLDDDIMHAEFINREKVCASASVRVTAWMRQKYAIMRHPESEIEGRREYRKEQAL